MINKIKLELERYKSITRVFFLNIVEFIKGKGKPKFKHVLLFKGYKINTVRQDFPVIMERTDNNVMPEHLFGLGIFKDKNNDK